MVMEVAVDALSRQVDFRLVSSWMGMFCHFYSDADGAWVFSFRFGNLFGIRHEASVSFVGF